MPGFTEIRDRFGPFDMSAIEIGAYQPAWGDIHMGPANALAALEMLGGGPLLPIHWGTFDLATHRWDQPVGVVTRLAARSGAELILPRLGEPVEPGSLSEVSAWWRPVAELHTPVGRGGVEERVGANMGRGREEPAGPDEPID